MKKNCGGVRHLSNCSTSYGHAAIAAVAVVLASWSSVGCAAAQAPRSLRSKPGTLATFAVHIPDMTSGAGSDRLDVIEMTMTNESNRTLWVNARMVTGVSGSRIDVMFDVEGPSGKLPDPCHSNIPFADDADYYLLKPGETIVRHSEMWCPGLLREPGYYSVRATYKDSSVTVPVTPEGAEHLADAVVAAPIRFRVLGP
jgi:hypothetical protein